MSVFLMILLAIPISIFNDVAFSAVVSVVVVVIAVVLLVCIKQKIVWSYSCRQRSVARRIPVVFENFITIFIIIQANGQVLAIMAFWQIIQRTATHLVHCSQKRGRFVLTVANAEVLFHREMVLATIMKLVVAIVIIEIDCVLYLYVLGIIVGTVAIVHKTNELSVHEVHGLPTNESPAQQEHRTFAKGRKFGSGMSTRERHRDTRD